MSSATLLSVLVAILLVVATALTTVGILNSINASRTPQTQQATATVTTGKISHTLNATLISVPETTQLVSAEGMATRNGIAKGAAVSEGSVLGVIQERPVILLQGPIPMFRALGRGSQGSDVNQLQEALRRLGYKVSDTAGSFGPTTATAVSSFYDKIGFPFVDSSGTTLSAAQRSQAGIPQNELVFLSSLPATAQSSCGSAGAQINGSLCAIASNKTTHYVKVLSTLLEGLDTNSLKDLPVSAPGTKMQGTLGAEVSAAQVATTGGDSSTASTSTVTQQSNAAVTDGQNISTTTDGSQYRYFSYASAATEEDSDVEITADSGVVITVKESAETGLILPSVALRNDASQASDTDFWVENHDGKHLPVSVGFCYGGECEVSGNDLSEGLTVLIPSNSGTAQDSDASAE
jgi:peptidoglycan hydrolase-like protein with peptidoglycan-binding domain